VLNVTFLFPNDSRIELTQKNNIFLSHRWQVCPVLDKSRLGAHAKEVDIYEKRCPQLSQRPPEDG